MRARPWEALRRPSGYAVGLFRNDAWPVRSSTRDAVTLVVVAVARATCPFCCRHVCRQRNKWSRFYCVRRLFY